MQKIGEVIPDFFENLMSKEYLAQMMAEMGMCGIGACFIYMLRKEYWLRQGMSHGDAVNLSGSEVANDFHAGRNMGNCVSRWAEQFEGCMKILHDCYAHTHTPESARVPPSLPECAQAPAGTISPKSKICGKLLSPSVPQGEIDADVDADVDADAAAETEEDTDAVDEILNNPDNHSIWFDTTCCNLVWGDLLKDNLPWVLTYFRGHLYRNGEEQELHDIRDFKRHFFNFCRNPISANEMLKALHYHLDSLSREQGIVSSEATFRTMMQNDFPNLYQMMIPMTMEQCNDLIRKYGPQRVKQAMQSANMSKRALYTADAYSLVVEKLRVKS